MSRAVVKLTEPVPLTDILIAKGVGSRLIVPVAWAERLLSAASVSLPANVILLNSLPAEPTVSPALKSVLGKSLTVNVSAALPRLIVTDPLGFAKTVVSYVPLLLRSSAPPPGDPPCSRNAVLALAGRLNVIFSCEPVLVIGSRPV